MAPLPRFASAMQASCLRAVLLHHIAKAPASLEEVGRLAESCARVIRRAASACPDLPSIGIQEARARSPLTYKVWLDRSPAGSLRENHTTQGPGAKIASWNSEGVFLDGVVCCARAESRIRSWRKAQGVNASSPPPTSLLLSLVHTSVLPTAVASKADHWWLADCNRWMSVREVGRAFGIRENSPLMEALCGSPYPASAVAVAGKAIHAGVARLILSKLHTEGMLPAFIRYGSSCSGADFFAEAVDSLWDGQWAYLHAAERDPVPRRILASAWGLHEEFIFLDAASEEAASAEEVDLYVLSPDCVDFSRRRHARSNEVVASGAVNAASQLSFVQRGKAKVVVIENVDEPDGVGALTDLICEISCYTWRSQALDSLLHAGVPVRRSRRFWVGVRV